MRIISICRNLRADFLFLPIERFIQKRTEMVLTYNQEDGRPEKGDQTVLKYLTNSLLIEFVELSLAAYSPS